MERDTRIDHVDRKYVVHRARSLPHWELDGGVYFVTFRLADSIPREVIETYLEEQAEIKDRWTRATGETRHELEREMARLYCRRIDQSLDGGLGECYLRIPAVSKLVAESVQCFDRSRYDLFAWAVVPNHVHVLLRPADGYTLSKILHSWKSYSATRANALLGRRGEFWQREYFDHLVRSEDDLRRFARYIQLNPERAKLNRWPWVWVCEELRSP